MSYALVQEIEAWYMATIPKGYRAMAWAGFCVNILEILFSASFIVLTTLGAERIDPENLTGSLLSMTAISYAFQFLYFPLSVAGALISWRLIKRRKWALSRVRLFFVLGIIISFAEMAGEAKFNLDATTGTASEIAIGTFAILLQSLVLSFWDREQVRAYIDSYRN